MPLAALALMAIPARQIEVASQTDIRPLTIEDAISKVYVRPGRIVSVGDLDGDGGPEIALASVAGNEFAIQAWSACEGRLVRTLWRGWVPGVSSSELPWDAGGDLDADGILDVVVGSPYEIHAKGRTGTVLVTSGASGALLRLHVAPEGMAAFGCSVAFAGDIDGDGHDDIIVGCRNIVRFELLVDQLIHADPDPSVGDPIVGPGRVVAYSGRSGSELWTVQRGGSGDGFGGRLERLGDLDEDYVPDWIVESDGQSGSFAALLSGATGKELGSMPVLGQASYAGDFDGDGIPDICVGTRAGSRIVSGARRETTCQIPTLDPFSSDIALAQAVGDLDDDGYGDVAMGAPSFRLPGRRSPAGDSAVDFPGTLAEILRQPFQETASSVSSGCVVVYSGRTRAPIWGCIGRPDQHDQLGLGTAAIPDVSGDGYPDLVVAGSDRSYVLPGPGKAR
jgi:hypothetical protein